MVLDVMGQVTRVNLIDGMKSLNLRLLYLDAGCAKVGHVTRRWRLYSHSFGFVLRRAMCTPSL